MAKCCQQNLPFPPNLSQKALPKRQQPLSSRHTSEAPRHGLHLQVLQHLRQLRGLSCFKKGNEWRQGVTCENQALRQSHRVGGMTIQKTGILYKACFGRSASQILGGLDRKWGGGFVGMFCLRVSKAKTIGGAVLRGTKAVCISGVAIYGGTKKRHRGGSGGNPKKAQPVQRLIPSKTKYVPLKGGPHQGCLRRFSSPAKPILSRRIDLAGLVLVAFAEGVLVGLANGDSASNPLGPYRIWTPEMARLSPSLGFTTPKVSPNYDSRKAKGLGKSACKNQKSRAWDRDRT